jgi:hypothetical protein
MRLRRYTLPEKGGNAVPTGLNRFALIIAGVLACVATAAYAQTKPEVTDLGQGPKTTIYIGNSFFYYNNMLGGHVTSMNRAVDPANKDKYRSTSVTIGGSGLDWHDVESYFRPNAIGRYSFDDQNNIVFNKLDKLFDFAITMDCSQCPIHPQLKPIFYEQTKRFAETVRKHGTEPVFFMSWAYADKPEMTAQLTQAYTSAGNANHALVIPAGLAFARSVEKRPDLNLYAADKRHPSLLGTYLAAATVFGALYDKSPVGNSYTAGIESETANFLQTVAWETVQKYYGRDRTN